MWKVVMVEDFGALFGLQWGSLCCRNRSGPNLDERKGAKYPRGRSRNSSSTRSNAKFRLAIHFRQVIFKNRLRNVDGRENVGDQTDGQGDRKAADGSGAEQKQEEGGHNCGDVRIDNGQKRLVEACLDGGRRRLAVA